MKYLLMLISILFILTTSAMADCEYNGKTYPTGTIIGPLICMPDGTWQSK